MNWTKNPHLVNRLAASYVLGTLQGPARKRFEKLLQNSPAAAQSVATWTERFSPLLTTLKPITPRPAVWEAIEQRARFAPDTLPPIWRKAWWQRLIAPIPAGALVVGLMVGSVAPTLWRAQFQDATSQLPQSYVGVLGTAQGKPGLIVSSLRHSRSVDIKLITPVAVPVNQRLYLWRIDKDQQVNGIGFVPEGKFVNMPISETAEKVFFPAIELAVSAEPAGSTPTAPTTAFLYRGLCGKLWK